MAQVTNRQDFLKVCVKIVSDSNINTEASSKLIELMVAAFDIGVTVTIKGQCEVTS